MLYTFLDMSQPSVVCLNSLRSAGVRLVGVRSAGVGIAGVGHRSREARRRAVENIHNCSNYPHIYYSVFDRCMESNPKSVLNHISDLQLHLKCRN